MGSPTYTKITKAVPTLRGLGLGTIHLRRRQIFTIFDPYLLPSAFQQNAYKGDF